MSEEFYIELSVTGKEPMRAWRANQGPFEWLVYQGDPPNPQNIIKVRRIPEEPAKHEHVWRVKHNSIVYTSLPPKYELVCNECGEEKVGTWSAEKECSHRWVVSTLYKNEVSTVGFAETYCAYCKITLHDYLKTLEHKHGND